MILAISIDQSIVLLMIVFFLMQSHTCRLHSFPHAHCTITSHYFYIIKAALFISQYVFTMYLTQMCEYFDRYVMY